MLEYKKENDMKELTINVFDITQEFAVDANTGYVIYNKINNALTNNDKIIIDFSGVNIILSVFLNAAISEFCTKEKFDDFTKKVEFVNLSESAQILWERVVLSAKRKYQTN